MKKLKILVFSDYAFTKGGAEKVAVTSSIGLVNRGHEVVFFSAVGPVCDDLKDAPFEDIISLGQKDILDNPNKLKALYSGIYNQAAVRRLKNLLAEWKPDIAHMHGLSKALSWAPINVLNRYKIPIVYTLHDYGLICPNLGIYNYRSESNCEFYKPGYMGKCLISNCDKRNYGQKLWRWFRFYFTTRSFRIIKKINAFIAVSNFLKEIMTMNLDISVPFKVIYNPVENIESKYDKSIIKPDKKDTVFLYVGRLSPEKGVDLLLGAMENIDSRLIIIGDGELRAFCEDRSRKLGTDRIKVMGYQSKEVIADQMALSDILILPSRCMEPAPLVLGEAAYHGLAAIVANHGGMAEFIKDGLNGLHFQAGDKDSLVSTMEMVINDTALIRQLGDSARKSIKEAGLDIAVHLDKIERFYRYILSGKK